MLNPVNTLSRYITQRGLSDAVYAAKETALLNALSRPSLSYTGDVAPDIVAVYAHGPLATRVIRNKEGFEVQQWHFGEDDWVRLEAFDVGASGYMASTELAKVSSGEPLRFAEFAKRWERLNSEDEHQEVFESRLEMAEFFYDQQGIAWDDVGTNPWAHLTDVATVVFMHDGQIPPTWDPKSRERLRETLTNLQLAWGETQPVKKMAVDGSPRYLVSVSSVTEPMSRLRPNGPYGRNFGTKVDREWMTAEQLAATARHFGINKASYPSPTFAEHVWWVSKPTAQGVLETSFQLDVHELTDAAAGVREPTAEDFQRIANVMGVAFEEPLALPAPRGVVIHHEEMGIYLGNALGLGFWSKLDPAGQDAAVVFASEVDAKAHMDGWDGGAPSGEITFPEVEADLQDGRYASVEACIKAGLSAWEVERQPLVEAAAADLS